VFALLLSFSPSRGGAGCSPLDAWHVTPPAAGYPGGMRGIAYGNGMYLAGSWGNRVLTSSDGIEWTTYTTTPPGVFSYVEALTFGNGRFVAARQASGDAPYGLVSSADGLHWIPHSLVTNAHFWDVEFAGGRFVAVGGQPGRSNAVVATSTDGLNWSVQQFPGKTYAQLTSIAYDNGLYVASGTDVGPFNRVLMTSHDTVNWTQSALPVTGNSWIRVLAGNGVLVAYPWVAVGTNLAWRSTNGIDWTNLNFGPAAESWMDGIYAENHFVIGGYSTNFLFSPDGLTWKKGSLSTGGGLSALGLLYRNGRFTAVGSHVVQSGSFVPAPPRIAQSPQPRILKAGQHYTNYVAADAGCSPRYQWRVNGTDLPGATNALLLVTNAPESLSGLHSVVVANDLGVVTSDVARVIAAAPVAIRLNPVSQSVVRGGNATFSVEVTGTPTVFYRWRRQGGLMPRFAATDENCDFLTVTNVQAGGIFSVVVSNYAITPGVLSADATLTVLEDTDGDGLPDEFEAANGLGTNNPADATLDADNDGLSNADEYLAGTDPRDAGSFLQVDRIDAEGGARIEFSTRPGRTYTVQYTEAVPAIGRWLNLHDVAARTNAAIEVVTDPAPGPRRFYRLVTPRQEP
jgi:hypothetical protein